MIEPLRSQYLAALGIENYAPRFILPGAKLSEPCEWLEAPVEDTSSALVGENVDVPASSTASSAENNIAEKLAGEIRQRAPIIESAVKSRTSESSAAKAPSSHIETEPQFALSIVLAGGGILLIDAAPAASAERAEFQKLLNNMLPALRPAAAQYVLDIFIWPLTRQPKVSRDAAAATETLAAYLNKQIKQRAIDTVLLLGETAQQWCTFGEGEVRIVKSNSLLACVHDPALKRRLWNDIRHIADQ